MQLFSTTRSKAIPIFFVTKNDLKGWMSGQSEKTKRWLNLSKFSGAQGEICLVPEINGNLGTVVVAGHSGLTVLKNIRSENQSRQNYIYHQSMIDEKSWRQSALLFW